MGPGLRGFPSLAETLASSQLLFPHVPTGSPRETHFPAHTPSALIRKPCAARGPPGGVWRESIPMRLPPRFWVPWGPQASLPWWGGGTPRHAKVWMNHQPHQCLAPRGQVYFQGSGEKRGPPSKASNLPCQEVPGPLARLCWPMSSAGNVEWTEQSLWEEGEDKNGRGS